MIGPVRAAGETASHPRKKKGGGERLDEEERAYWAAWNRIPGMGSRRFQSLLCHFGTAKRAWEAGGHELEEVLAKAWVEQVKKWRPRIDPERELVLASRLGAGLLTWRDRDYPWLLREVADPPPVLYVKGTIEPRDLLAVAIVGTRKASRRGREMAHLIARGLAESGVTVVSGLARGIDGVAHDSALRAGGRSLAVLGCGIDRIYPPEHEELSEALTRQGALLSPYAPGTPPLPTNFPARNRIISGLTWGTVVIEAGRSSGALVTAAFACQQNRDVCAVPGDTANYSGCLRLISEGAAPVCCADDVLRHLNLARLFRRWQSREYHEAAGRGEKAVHPQRVLEFPSRRPAPAAEGAPEGLPPGAAGLWGRLQQGSATFDELLHLGELPAGELQILLLRLELAGLVVREEGGRYRAAARAGG